MFFVFAYNDYYPGGGESDCQDIAETLDEAMQWEPSSTYDRCGIYTVRDHQFVEVAEGRITIKYGPVIEPALAVSPYHWGPPPAPRRETTYHVAWTVLPTDTIEITSSAGLLPG